MHKLICINHVDLHNLCSSTSSYSLPIALPLLSPTLPTPVTHTQTHYSFFKTCPIYLHGDLLQIIIVESCVHGDSQRRFNGGQTCIERLLDFPGRCYDPFYKVRCCETCPKLHTGVKGNNGIWQTSAPLIFAIKENVFTCKKATFSNYFCQ